MRTILTTLALFLSLATLFAQVPQGINYQAVMRDANGNPTSQMLSVTFEIFSNSSGSGTPDFSETHPSVAPATLTGLFNLTIGKNNPNGFAAIDWASGSKFLKVTINGIPGPVTEMLSVPYALYAESAGNSQTYMGGSGIQITGNTITNTGDTNPSDDLTISSNAGGDVSGIFSNLQINTGAVGTAEIADGSIQSNDLGSMGATNGKVLKWNGSAWVPQDDLTGSISLNGTQNYVAKFTPNGTSVENSIIFDDGTNVGIGMNNPDDKLDVSGSAQVSNYLKVGNPFPPSSIISYSPLPLYKLSYLSGSEGLSQFTECGSTEWYVVSTGVNSGKVYCPSIGSRNRAYLFSPWVWVPSGSFYLIVEGTFSCNLEDNYDGVFLEYRIGSDDWTTITDFEFSGYPDFAQGSNATCTGSDAQTCWNGYMGTNNFRVSQSQFLPNNTPGNWIRFRFVAMEDASTGGGEFAILGFNVTAFGGTSVGGSFAAGNIYAEKNVYAGSNVLLGDVAEYFDVDVKTEPGDLISISPEKNNSYTVNKKACNPFILGIHSANPTVTLNAPKGTPVCLTGRVPVKVCNKNGEIKIGDYLTSASLQGYAMRADQACYIVGRALENFNGETGKILCMVETGWYNPITNTRGQSGGSFFIKGKANSIAVYDASVKSDSRVFVTFRENAGNYWISNISEGVFVVNLDKKTNRIIPFDYFVDNANPTIHNGQTLFVEKEIVNNELFLKDTNSKLIPMEEYSDELPPGIPSEPNKAWIWSKKTGFKMKENQ